MISILSLKQLRAGLYEDLNLLLHREISAKLRQSHFVAHKNSGPELVFYTLIQESFEDIRRQRIVQIC